MLPWCVVTSSGLVVTRIADLSARYEIPDISIAEAERWKEENIYRLRDKTKFTQSRPSEQQIRKFRSAAAVRRGRRAPWGGKAFAIPMPGMRDERKKRVREFHETIGES